MRDFSGSERSVAGYLMAEVLERQPPEVRELLLRTSILDRVTGRLADALTGRSGSERILLDLEEANAFVTSLDADRTWFRYHHLFADFLRLELRRTDPASIDSLHRTAARWYEEHGHPAEAIRHAQAASDWTYAARVLADSYISLILDGRLGTVARAAGNLSFRSGGRERRACDRACRRRGCSRGEPTTPTPTSRWPTGWPRRFPRSGADASTCASPAPSCGSPGAASTSPPRSRRCARWRPRWRPSRQATSPAPPTTAPRP